jgi:sulfite reductase (NADPH) hemoprotein beta-component
MAISTVSAVARIVYLTSDVVADAPPAPPTSAPFATAFASLSRTARLSAPPSVIALPHGADSGSALLRRRDGGLLALTAATGTGVLPRLVPHLSELASLPVVISVAVGDDLSEALLFRSAVPFFLYSATAAQAQDHALLAARLARTENKAVVHAFYEGEEEALEEVEAGKIAAFLTQDKSAGQQENGLVNGLEENTVAADLLHAYEAAAASALALTRRECPPYTVRSSANPETVVFTFGRAPTNITLDGVSFIDVSLFSPLPASALLSAIPPSVQRVLVLEQVHNWPTKWTPFYLDLVSGLQRREVESRPTIQSGVLGSPQGVTAEDLSALLEQAASASPSTRLQLGPASGTEVQSPVAPHVPRHETSYTKMLAQLFGERLDIANAPDRVAENGAAATRPEFALGRIRGQLDSRAELISTIEDLLADRMVSPEVHSAASKWALAKDNGVKSRTTGDALVKALEAEEKLPASGHRVLELREHLAVPSRWIIGSDAWAYDLGASGLHHVVASGLDVNVLVLDTVPYSSRAGIDPARRKQDVGLYAMNHGDVYVASVAVFSSYAQVLQALAEADRFRGPSVVLGYLPYATEDTPALEVLKETKLAVDAGYWPLYRWDPSKEAAGKEPFSLDSDAVKNELRAFLDRQNHLSQLSRATPQLATELVSSLGTSVQEARRARAKKAFDELVRAIDAPPLTVLFASDGGKAEKVAKRLAGRAQARGLTATVAPMDSAAIADLGQQEGFVAFVASCAGQGEFPQNGRTLMKSLNAAAAREETSLSSLQYAVFGMGDSHYWPRPEDRHYYNKAGKDLDARLAQLAGTRFADLGLGDDQDPDGPETGYKAWEPLVWKALGVDAVEVTEAEPEPITNEHIKAASGYLRGTIAEGLEDTTTGALAAADTQLTKFHGIYQQDDRDIRDERQAQGAEPAFSFMIRVRLPGGVCTPAQWLAMDEIADEHGNGTFKITTRQTFQFHGVIKRHLKPSIQAINRALLDTLAACGDVNR